MKFMNFFKDKPTYKLLQSDKDAKKLMVINPEGKKIYFGGGDNMDFILYNKIRHPKSNEKRKAYIARHSKLNEDWNKSGINTPGFWSRWLLWEKPTFKGAIDNIEEKFNINII